jgi:hypothetical protein
MGLEEVKEQTKAASCTKIIQCRQDGTPVVLLGAWTGLITSQTESGFAHLNVSYALNANTLTAHAPGKVDTIYNLN